MALMRRAAVKTIVAAEDAGVRQIWMAQPPNLPDALTTFASRPKTLSNVSISLIKMSDFLRLLESFSSNLAPELLFEVSFQIQL